MYYCRIFDFLEFSGHKLDRDTLERFDLFAILILESDIYSLYDLGVTAHLGLDCVLDCRSRDCFEMCSRSFRQCAFRCFDRNLDAANCVRERLCGILDAFFRLFYDFLLRHLCRFRIFSCFLNSVFC